MYSFPDNTRGNNGNCSAAPGWRLCSDSGFPGNCTDAQFVDMNGYIRDFVAVVQGTRTFHAAGNGAFVHSCHTHCEAISGGSVFCLYLLVVFDSLTTDLRRCVALTSSWPFYKIDNVSMQDAGTAWWLSDGEASTAHTYLPCQYRAEAPHKCNPTCPDNTGVPPSFYAQLEE